MIGLWSAYRALSGIKALAVNAGLVLALLVAGWGFYKVQIWRAEKRGAAAFEKGVKDAFGKVTREGQTAEDAAKDCHRRRDAGENNGRLRVVIAGSKVTCEPF